jgi:hypothetical protein
MRRTLLAAAAILALIGVAVPAGISATKAKTHKVTLAITGKGVVRVGKAKRAHCATTTAPCYVSVKVGTSKTVRLHAMPASAWKFTAWSGCKSATSACTLRLPHRGRIGVTFVPPGNQLNPYAFGKTGPVGNGWDVKINSTVPNADSIIEAVTDQYGDPINQPPPAGAQDYMVNVTLTYTGGGSSNAFDNVLDGLRAQGVHKADYAYYSCGTPPTPNFESVSGDLFSGQSLTGNVCFQVAVNDVSSLMVHQFGVSDVWFALK